jgi:endonuclease/exonuclease/phosphatase family metal-dependent hydrolase
VGGYGFEDRAEPARKVFRDVEAHIIGFQEFKKEDLFLDVFGQHGHHFVWGYCLPNNGFYCPIAYNGARLELRDNGFFHLTKTGGPGISFDDVSDRSVTWAVFEDRQTGEEILVVNTQFGFHPQSIREGMRLVMDFVKGRPEKRVIFLGDLNMNVAKRWHPRRWWSRQAMRNTFASWSAYALALKDGFRDAFTSARTADWIKRRKRKRTFTNFMGMYPGEDNGGTYDPDYIFVYWEVDGEKLHIALCTMVTVTVGGVDASDHLWVIMQLRYGPS